MKDCKFFDRYDYDLYKEYVSFQLKKVLEKKEMTPYTILRKFERKSEKLKNPKMA